MLHIRMPHHFLTKTLAAACAVLVLFTAQAFAGDYEKGVSAFRRGDYAEARTLLKPLAQEGDPYAQFAIAVMYDDGLGLPQNYGHALNWYGKAAQAGLVDAQYMAGRFHGGGRGVKQNPPPAFFWFDLAAAGGHPQAPRQGGGCGGRKAPRRWPSSGSVCQGPGATRRRPACVTSTAAR